MTIARDFDGRPFQEEKPRDDVHSEAFRRAVDYMRGSQKAVSDAMRQMIADCDAATARAEKAEARVLELECLLVELELSAVEYMGLSLRAHGKTRLIKATTRTRAALGKEAPASPGDECPHMHLMIFPDGRRECYGCGEAVPMKEAPDA